MSSLRRCPVAALSAGARHPSQAGDKCQTRSDCCQRHLAAPTNTLDISTSTQQCRYHTTWRDMRPQLGHRCNKQTKLQQLSNYPLSRACTSRPNGGAATNHRSRPALLLSIGVIIACCVTIGAADPSSGPMSKAASAGPHDGSSAAAPHSTTPAPLPTTLATVAPPHPAEAGKQQQQDKAASRQHATQPTVDRQIQAPSNGAEQPSPKQQTTDHSATKKLLQQQQQQQQYHKKQQQVAANLAKKSHLASQAGQGKPSAAGAPKPHQHHHHQEEPAADSGALSAASGVRERQMSSPAEPSGKSAAAGEPADQAAAAATDKAPFVAKAATHTQATNGYHQQHKSSSLRKFLPSFLSSPSAPSTAHNSNHNSNNRQQVRSSAGLASSLISSAAGSLRNPFKASASTPLNGIAKASSGPAPYFVRKSGVDRQSGGLAASLLSNPFGLGMLFAAPSILPSLILTPLALAGLSPAMSAINNFFGDDDETPAAGAASSTGGSSGGGPLSALASGNSPFAQFLQSAGGSSALSSSSGGASGDNAPSRAQKFAAQAMQTLLGPPTNTEKPLFNPGMFANSQGIGNAIGSLSSGSGGSSGGAGSSSSATGSSSSSSSSSSPMRNLFNGNFMQAAASVISPTFAAPPSLNSGPGSGSQSSGSDEDSGLMQMASNVFDKMASYMSPEKDTPAQASGSSSVAGSSAGPTSTLSALASLSSMSPFQLTSLLMSGNPGPTGAGSSSSSSSPAASSSAGSGSSRAGFLSTLKSMYELFSSSLRRQEVQTGVAANGQNNGENNECQQRLICELHQKAMNNKFVRRSIQSNIMEFIHQNSDSKLMQQLQQQYAQQQALSQPNVPITAQSIQARVDQDAKSYLEDFFKATRQINGGEPINCSAMFTKCTSSALLSAAVQMDPAVNNKAMSKFSSLMKKMRFKSSQQQQQHWKGSKPSSVQQSHLPAVANQQQAYMLAQPYGIPSDYLQVSSRQQQQQQQQQQQPLTPANSLKIMQQMLLAQQDMANQQQLQQQYNQQVAQSKQMQQQIQNYNDYANLQQQQQQQQQPVGAQQISTLIGYTQYNQPTAMVPQQQQQQQQQQQDTGYSPVVQNAQQQQQQQQQMLTTNLPVQFYSTGSGSVSSKPIGSDQQQQQPQSTYNPPVMHNSNR